MTNTKITPSYLSAHSGGTKFASLAAELSSLANLTITIDRDCAVYSDAHGWLSGQRVVELIAKIEGCDMASAVAAMWDGDGQRFTQERVGDPDPIEFDEFCASACTSDTWKHGHNCGDERRFVFGDMSAIVICGGSWDLGFDEPEHEPGCYCWASQGHSDDCITDDAIVGRDHVEGGYCSVCDEHAQLRECDGCGLEMWILNCGHMDQPTPIAADDDHDYCCDCYEEGMI